MAEREIEVILPDGMAQRVPAGTPVVEVLCGPERQVPPELIAARVNGKTVDLSRPLTEDATLEAIPWDDPEGQRIYHHSTTHIMAQAVKALFPETKITIGPAIEEGYYYDFDRKQPFTPEDLERIEAKMRDIIAADYPVHRMEWPRTHVREYFQERGEDYKIELLNEFEGDTFSCYQQGEFIDLCVGPHVYSTGRIKAIKLLKVAGAYWRGDEHNQMLQRIYGTSWPSEELLQRYLHKLEEARKRDHRVLGRQLDLFSLNETVGPGLVLWHPKGAMVRHVIETFWREEHLRRGYQFAYTPHIGRIQLWETSGHLGWYKENMFAAMEMEGQHYMAKPMNCPFHIQIYQSKLRSYRELPIRLFEFGTVYRYERGGALHGLLRVRGLTQDDAHIFCRPDQIKDEVAGVLDLVFYMMQSFGFEQYKIDLSLRDPNDRAKYIGSDAVWEQAENALEETLQRMNLPYHRATGEASFYGPKIDVKLVDAIGREWQMSTIQLDFQLPERFDVTYVAEDSQRRRTVMIHRAVLGAIERFFGILVEHYAGAFPVWLAPVQARVLTITDRQREYAAQVSDRLQAAGIRAEADLRNEKISYKIREAQLEKIPYMLVVGDREVSAGKVAVRLRGGKDLGPLPLDECVARIRDEIDRKVL
ncbi:MAG: threonine--tRNA ligase [Nitrospinae bacterium]|nr:threonine--tRNA ligase [Nitrospinota bacterium]